MKEFKVGEWDFVAEDTEYGTMIVCKDTGQFQIVGTVKSSMGRTPKPEIANFSPHYEEYLRRFNEASGKKYRGVRADEVHFKARLKEGWTIEDMIHSYKCAIQEPNHRETGGKYVTPEFCSRSGILNRYASRKSVPSAPSAPHQPSFNESRK
jgi:hypothetical protein